MLVVRRLQFVLMACASLLAACANEKEAGSSSPKAADSAAPTITGAPGPSAVPGQPGSNDAAAPGATEAASASTSTEATTDEAASGEPASVAASTAATAATAPAATASNDPWTVPAWTADCGSLGIEAGVSLDGFISDRYTWYDQECRKRSAAMVRNTQQDPAGLYGGYMREYRYEVNGTERVAVGSSSTHPGFGYLVNHYAGSSDSSRKHVGEGSATVLAGRHHAIHEYRWRYPLDGQMMQATVQWFFATGRSYPVWAVTYDLSAAPADALNADTRAPYGDITWDGGADADVDGVGWGDRYKFSSLGQPITPESGWDYTQPNTVPYAMEWSARADAEMGLVQTQPYSQHDAGGYSFYSSWGQRSDSGPMPQDYNWTYQLNQYELPWGSKSKRLAWGANYGAVGQTSYPVYGNDARACGYPYQSYSVHIILDPHTLEPVATQVAQVESAEDASLTAAVGTVVTSGPRGIARPDVAPYEPAGYNPIFATWEMQAQSNAARFTLRVPNGALNNPVFVVHDYTLDREPQAVRVAGTKLASDSGYFASIDTAAHTLWLTIPGWLSGSVEIEIVP